MTLPGIDFYSVMLIVAEIGDIGRFSDAKETVLLGARLVPSIHQSGNTNSHGKNHKEGGPKVGSDGF
jgi:transposase